MRKAGFLIIIVFLFQNIYSQERLVDLSSNPILKNSIHSSLKREMVSTTVLLPFIDDFSQIEYFPSQDLWIDNYSFINRTYPILPPSVGVATLDALDETGSHYDNALNAGYIADYLTSNQVNLDLAPSDSIYLSFYIQPGGIGNNPEKNDSLVLEFYAPESEEWLHRWSTIGYESDEFKQIMIPIADEKFLKENFQFRFYNYASFDNDDPVLYGNIDHWHIDYVRLDKDRSLSDTIIHDVAFVDGPRSALLNYEAMPWGDHFKFGKVSERENLRYVFRNNDTIVRNIAYIYRIHTDESGELQKYDSAYLGQINLTADSLLIKRPEVKEDFFQVNNNDKVVFKIEYILETDEFDYHNNDTMIYYQYFDNYYAYDDGTPENGYGVDAENAMVAYQFKTYVEDSLRAVKIFFNRTNENANQKYFIITVWDDNNGIPGDILHEQTFRVEYSNIGSLYTYQLDSVFAVSDIFYVGWRQVTSDFLNVGFDKNRKNNDKIFYNLNGPWYNSSFAGSLMIRPVLSQNPLTGVASLNIPEIDDIVIYPNPASDYFNVDCEECTNITVFVFDNLGRLVLSTNDKYISTSNLNSGFYNVLIQKGNSRISKKLILQK